MKRVHPALGDPHPVSAVGHGVGLAGLAGLVLWTLVAWRFGMDGPHAGLTAVLACALPMLLWSLCVDRVHRSPTTGIDWTDAPRPWRDVVDIALVKITGLWATWGVIAVLYCLARWYWEGDYRLVMRLMGWVAPVLLAASIPYVLWLDRYLVDRRDGAYAFGQWVIGGAAGTPDRDAMDDHLRAWAIKGFFLAFMLSIVPGNFANVVRWRAEDVIAGPASLAGFLIMAMFLVDVVFATVGYMLTLRPLDAHIRSANPFTAGWVAALICYPPFVLMGPGGPLDYHRGGAEWDRWLAGYPALLWIVGAALVALTAVYAWATVAFGLRFSNLTNRGILTHGPYRWTRHPAYLAKNLFWWLSALPFLAASGDLIDAARNTATLGIVSGVYYWRARTEEAHLSADPAYRTYSAWMARNAPLPRLLAALTGKSVRPLRDPGMQPAE
jgi:protein-S-isoprenylcysteine O-methyltransferase Ste14